MCVTESVCVFCLIDIWSEQKLCSFVVVAAAVFPLFFDFIDFFAFHLCSVLVIRFETKSVAFCWEPFVLQCQSQRNNRSNYFNNSQFVCTKKLAREKTQNGERKQKSEELISPNRNTRVKMNPEFNNYYYWDVFLCAQQLSVSIDRPKICINKCCIDEHLPQYGQYIRKNIYLIES